MTIIEQRSLNLRGAGNIKCRTKQRNLEWEEKTFKMLNSTTVFYVESYLNCKREDLDTKERVKAFSSLIYRGETREAIRYICEREYYVFHVDDRTEITGLKRGGQY